MNSFCLTARNTPRFLFMKTFPLALPLLVVGCLSVVVVAYTFSFQTHIIVTYVVTALVYAGLGVMSKYLQKRSSVSNQLSICLLLLPAFAFTALLFTVDYKNGGNHIPATVPTLLILSLLNFEGFRAIYDSEKVRGYSLVVVSVFLSLFMGVYYVPKIEYGASSLAMSSKVNLSSYLINVNGDTVTMASLKNKVKFFEFTFIGCGACETKKEYLEKLYLTCKEKHNITFFFIHNGSIDTKLDFIRYASKSKYPHLFYYDDGGNVCKQLQIKAYPTEVILDLDNRIIHSLAGFSPNMGQIHHTRAMKIINNIPKNYEK